MLLVTYRFGPPLCMEHHIWVVWDVCRDDVMRVAGLQKL